MRIIHGTLSGRRLQLPKNLKARPTTDLARESLFNILINRIDFESSSVLDLFGGTGSISYEFASLGCADIVCVDNNTKHIEQIKKNCDALGIESIRAIRGDVFKFLNHVRSEYDLIFADPPYDLPGLIKIPGLVKESGVLKSSGVFILEHGPNNKFNEETGFLEERKYGKVHFSFFSF